MRACARASEKRADAIDYDNENAANRLVELSTRRGDVEELRRLVEAGNEVAVDRLTKLIRDSK